MNKQESIDLVAHLDRTTVDLLKATAKHLDSLLKLQDISPVPLEAYGNARTGILQELTELLTRTEETRTKLMRTIDNYTFMERMN